jgi:lysozyme
MQISDQGLEFIKQFEGCKLQAYKDVAGVITIGYGTIIYQDGTKPQMGDEITLQRASDELRYQANLKAQQISPMVSVSLNQNQVDSLIDFAYNCGTGAFHGSTLRKLINANPADPNITDAFLMWSKVRIDGQLVVNDWQKKRRQAEAKLYFTV